MKRRMENNGFILQSGDSQSASWQLTSTEDMNNLSRVLGP